jgi:hypothetical protein
VTTLVVQAAVVLLDCTYCGARARQRCVVRKGRHAGRTTSTHANRTDVLRVLSAGAWVDAYADALEYVLWLIDKAGTTQWAVPTVQRGDTAVCDVVALRAEVAKSAEAYRALANRHADEMTELYESEVT